MRPGLDYSLFSRPANRSRVLPRDEAMVEPISQRTPSLLGRVRTAVAGIVVRLGRHLRVLQQGLQPFFPVNFSHYALHERVGDDIISIGTSLHGTIPERGSAVRHITVVPIDVDERANELLVHLGLENVEEWRRAAEGVPQGEHIVIVGLVAVPFGVLARLVSGDEMHEVNGRVETPEVVLVRVRGYDPGEDASVPCLSDLGTEICQTRALGDLCIDILACSVF